MLLVDAGSLLLWVTLVALASLLPSISFTEPVSLIVVGIESLIRVPSFNILILAKNSLSDFKGLPGLLSVFGKKSLVLVLIARIIAFTISAL